MSKEELKQIVSDATGVGCEVEANQVNREFVVRTNCNYIGVTDLCKIMSRAELLKVASEGGQITLLFTF